MQFIRKSELDAGDMTVHMDAYFLELGVTGIYKNSLTERKLCQRSRKILNRVSKTMMAL